MQKLVTLFFFLLSLQAIANDFKIKCQLYNYVNRKIQPAKHGTFVFPQTGWKANQTLYVLYHYDRDADTHDMRATLSTSSKEDIRAAFKDAFGYQIYVLKRLEDSNGVNTDYFELLHAKVSEENARLDQIENGDAFFNLSKSIYSPHLIYHDNKQYGFSIHCETISN